MKSIQRAFVLTILTTTVMSQAAIKSFAQAALSMPIPAAVTIENPRANNSSLPRVDNDTQKSYAQQRLIVHEQAHSAQLKEIIYSFFGKTLAKKIESGEFALGSSLEIDGIIFRRFAHGLGQDSILVSISIPYFESVEKKSPTKKENAKFALMATIAHLVQITREKCGLKDQYKEINTFLEAAGCLHIASPLLCEKSYIGIGTGELFARCRRIEQSRWLGLGEPQYSVECLLYLPLATIKTYNQH